MNLFKSSIIVILILLLLVGMASAGAPNITAYSPTTDPTDQTGTGGGFSIISNQSGIISWYVNSTLKQYEYGSSSTYINTTAGVQTNAYNVSVTISNSNGVSTHIWNWTVTAVNPPGIISYSPSSYPNDSVGTARTFSIVSNQTIVCVWWYINGTLKQTSSGGAYTTSYINSTTGAQNNRYTVTATLNTTNGNASVTWYWKVNSLAPPSITGYLPATDPSDLNTSSRSFNVTANQTGTITWYINGTLKQTDTSVTDSTYTNSTAGYQANPYNVTAIFSGTNGTTSRMWNWTRTIAPTISAVSPTAGSTTTTLNSTFNQMFNVTADRTANTTWKIDGVQKQYNTSQTVMNYTNSTAGVGTYTVTAITNNTNGTGNTLTWTWIVKQSTMSGTNLSSNLSSAGRVVNGTNSTYNFTWTDTGNITRINFTFPTTFKFSALESANVSSNLGTMTVTLDETTGLISLYNATGLNNSAIYVNFTGSLKAPVTSSDNTITVTSNKNPTGTTFTIRARDTTKPYFVVANNSVFTVGTETFGTLTTTVPLTGTGSTNLTFYAPNVTGQTNITAGYGATNASKVKAVFTGGANGNYTIYVETNPNVANPIIVLSAPNEMESSNLPAALVAGGTIAGVVIIYLFRRRRHED